MSGYLVDLGVMKKYLFLIMCFFVFSMIISSACVSKGGEHPGNNNYKVVTGFCDKGSEIKVFKNETVIYHLCGGDGIYQSYGQININNDSIPDFVYSYNMEDYYDIGVLVSTSSGYDDYMFDYEYDAIDLYANTLKDGAITVTETDSLADFMVTDIDKDHQDDLLVNFLIRDDSIYRIPTFTDTIYHSDILKLIEQKKR